MSSASKPPLTTPFPVRGRWAPTPSGALHVGNARTALVAWLSIRRQGGVFVWRLEDLDGPRTVRGMAEAAEDDLRWLGLDWDEGPGIGGPFAPYRQSERHAMYESALERLDERGLLFPCRLSRSDLRHLATAPHGRPGLPPYPASLRPAHLPAGWLEELRQASAGGTSAQGDSPRGAALRFKVHETPVAWNDLLYGERTERVDREVGDFVLKRRDGVYAYQLAVVVDDLRMAIGEVVRGCDLLGSTARQIQLFEALGARPPVFGHLPLVLNAAGEKLSKRDAGWTIAALREAGVRPERLVGYLSFSLGLRDKAAPASPRELVESFAWDRLRREDWILPEDLKAKLSVAPRA